MKINKMLSFDIEVAELAKSRDLNISGLCNEFLKNYMNMEELEKTSKEELEDMIKEKTAELQALKSHNDILKRKEEEKRNKLKGSMMVRGEDFDKIQRTSS